MNFKNILFPTDFSDCSAHALQYAMELARKYGARLHILHVLHDVAVFFQPDAMAMAGAYEVFFAALKTDATKNMEALKKSIPSEFKTESAILDGPETDGILNFAAKNSIDLIVMGTHGRRGFQKLVLGSTTEKIVRQAACPVLTVRSE